MAEPKDVAERRARLAGVEDRLARLGAAYDLAMSAFKFDEARDLSARIEAAEEECRMLAENLPTPPPVPPVSRRHPVPPRRRRRR